jgi:hypothetical protein
MTGVGRRGRTESKVFFSEEKKQKTLFIGLGVAPRPRQNCKSFLVLFFKKELLPFFLRGSPMAKMQPAAALVPVMHEHPLRFPRSS